MANNADKRRQPCRRLKPIQGKGWRINADNATGLNTLSIYPIFYKKKKYTPLLSALILKAIQGKGYQRQEPVGDLSALILQSLLAASLAAIAKLPKSITQ